MQHCCKYMVSFAFATSLHYICIMRNIRNTKSVNIILDAFSNSGNALSVVELVKRFQSDMNKTTVYRILERLEGAGILHSFSGANGLKWFAKSQGVDRSNHSDNHSHFQCQKCGKAVCLPVDIAIPAVARHRVDSVNVILTGQCEDCLS